MTMKLRDLIRAVRNCKTAADERAVITKESALIRSSFKDDVSEYKHSGDVLLVKWDCVTAAAIRVWLLPASTSWNLLQERVRSTALMALACRNVAKLLYIWLLGYPTHFGYMECIKLLASPSFAEKRIGYLALTLLLDEKTEVLTLVTNSISKDLQTGASSVVGLALTAVGNIASAEMAADLSGIVNEKLKDKSDYVKKKAALCVIRMIKKVPELIDTFLPNIVVLLTDKAMSVLLTGITLITAVVELQPEYIEKFTRLVPALVKILRKLLSAGYLPQYDVGGVADPFLQVKVIHLLRILGKGNASASEAMSSTLAQVATNTEALKNAGNAVLYEVVNAIMSVESEPGLRVLAVNILGKFLANKDANLKYVALETLTKVVHLDIAAVQRHRNVVVECLRDDDTSIRKRALDLVYCLVNTDNVRSVTKELLNYLTSADADTKPDLCVKIAAVADKFAESKRWHIDTLISMLATAGNAAKKVAISQTLFLISHATGDHAIFTHKLFTMAAAALNGTTEAQQALLQVAVWVIGEYGEKLLSPPPKADTDDISPPYGDARTETEIVRFLDKLLHVYYVLPETKAMVLTALLKLTSRCKDAAAVAKARSILATYETATDLELQARSVEFTYISDPSRVPSLGPHRSGLLAPMPLLDEAVLRSRVGAATGAATDAATLAGENVAMAVQERGKETPHASSGTTTTEADLLGDLSDLLGTGLTVSATTQHGKPSTAAATTAAPAVKKASAAVDLDALFSTISTTAGDNMSSTPSIPTSSPPTNGTSKPISALDALDDLLGGAMPSSSITTAAAPSTNVSALDAMFGGVSPPPAAPAVHPHHVLNPAVHPSKPPAPASAAVSGDDEFGEPVSAVLPLPHTFIAFESAHIRVTLSCDKPSGFGTSATDITATFAAKGTSLKNFVCQVAPPKYLKLTLLPASGTHIGANSNITQMIKVDNSQQGTKPVMLKLRLSYVLEGQTEPTVESPEIKSFPPTL